MERERKTLKEWCKEHKKGLMIAGSVVVVTGIGIAGYFLLKDNLTDLSDVNMSLYQNAKGIKNVENINVSSSTTTDYVSDSIKGVVSRRPHGVSEHVRNLPEGWHASLKKIIEAKEAGIDLLDGQTYVEAYSTGKNKAA